MLVLFFTVCMYIYIYIYTRVCIYIYININTHTHTYIIYIYILKKVRIVFGGSIVVRSHQILVRNPLKQSW